MAAPKLARILHVGHKGRDVLAVKHALMAALGAHHFETDARNSTFGRGTMHDVIRFQRAHQLEADGVVGAVTWGHLWPFVPRWWRYLILAPIPKPKPHDTEDTLRDLMVHRALWFVAHAGWMRYHQNRPIPFTTPPLPPTARRPDDTDCSGSFIQIYRWSYVRDDPSGNNWNGAGWTGDLEDHGQPITMGQIKRGDAVLYRNPGHVVMALEDAPCRRCFSFGSNPPHIVWPGYRSIFAIRRYRVTRR